MATILTFWCFMKTISRWLAQFYNSGSRCPYAFKEALAKDRAESMEFDHAAAFLDPQMKGNLIPHRRLRVGKPYFTSDFFLRQQERADWNYTDLRIRFFAARFAHEMRKAQVPIFCIWAYRTPSEQNQMVQKGVSKASFPRAAHTQGAAVDLIHSGLFWDGMRQSDWDFFGSVGKGIARRHNIPIKWGGDWDFYDPAHWELSDWKQDIDPLPKPVLPPLRKTLFKLNLETPPPS